MKAYVTTTKYYIANGCIDIPDTLANDEEQIHEYINDHQDAIEWDEDETPDGNDGIYLEELGNAN